MIHNPSLGPSLGSRPLGTTLDVARSKAARGGPDWSWRPDPIGGVWIPFVAKFRRSITSALGLASGRVLEVGVGNGGGLPGYARQVEVIGTEADAERLRRARTRVAGQALDNVAGLHRMEPSALSFPDDSFDAVTAFFVLRRGKRPLRVMSEIVRVTRPGGRIIVVNRLAMRGIARRFARLVRHVSGGLSQRLRDAALPARVLQRRADLEFVSARPVGPFGLLTVCEFAKKA